MNIRFFCMCFQQELVVALSHLVVQYESNFCTVALQFIEEEKNYTVPSPANTAGTGHTRTQTMHTEIERFWYVALLQVIQRESNNRVNIND